MIDSGFRGNIFITLINHGLKTFNISQGDKVAQIIIERCVDILLVEANLTQTERGTGCLGSTGLNVMDNNEFQSIESNQSAGEQSNDSSDSFLTLLYN